MSRRTDEDKSGGSGSGSGSGLGGFLTFVGGSLVGAALAYGAVKLSSYIEEQQQREAMATQPAGATGLSESCAKSLDDDDDPPAMGYSDRPPHDPQPTRSTYRPPAAPSSTESRPSTGHGESDVLHERLTNYYKFKVEVSESGLSELSYRLDSMRAELQQALSETLGGNVKVNIPIETGFLQSVILRYDQDVSLTLPMIIELDDLQWKCIHKEGDPVGYFKISKLNSDTPDIWSPLISSGCLNPLAVQKVFAKIMGKAASADGFAQLLKSSSSDDVPVVQMKVPSMRGLPYYFKVQYRPACRVNDMVVETIPSCEEDLKNQMLWKQNFSVALCSPILNPTQIKCIQILATISAVLKAELGFLTIEMLHSLVLHVAEMEDNWVDSALSERFIDLLKALEEYCNYKQMAHYFVPQRNLLEDASDQQLKLATIFISKNIGRNTLHHLLV